MKILVCGSRDWNDPHPIYLMIAGCSLLATTDDPLIVVHGAARGADYQAGEMASLLGVTTLEFPAKWDEHGKSAGPIRNQQMLDENQIDVTYAFRMPGKSNGTDDMIRRSKAAGIPTYVITKE